MCRGVGKLSNNTIRFRSRRYTHIRNRAHRQMPGIRIPWRLAKVLSYHGTQPNQLVKQSNGTKTHRMYFCRTFSHKPWNDFTLIPTNRRHILEISIACISLWTFFTISTLSAHTAVSPLPKWVRRSGAWSDLVLSWRGSLSSTARCRKQSWYQLVSSSLHLQNVRITPHNIVINNSWG